MSMMNAKYVMVTVRRNPMEVTPQTVFGHEFALLEVKHGEGNVTLLDELPEGVNPDIYDEVHELDVGEEWSRLHTVYGNHPEISMPLVEYVFKNDPKALAKAGIKKPSSKVDTDGNGKLKKAEITAKLDELEVEYKAGDKRDDLLALLHTTLVERLEELEAEFDEEGSVEVLAKTLEEAEAE